MIKVKGLLAIFPKSRVRKTKTKNKARYYTVRSRLGRERDFSEESFKAPLLLEIIYYLLTSLWLPL